VISMTEESKWLEDNPNVYQELAGQWIAIKGKRLIAHGARLKDVLIQSKASGIEHPFVVALPEQDEEIIIVGLTKAKLMC